MARKQSIFIVHGRKHSVRDRIDLFLTKELRLRTTVMEAGAWAGHTLPEKLEKMAKGCSFAVFLVTGDDQLILKRSKKVTKRARQNVILEIGYFWASLGRKDRIALLAEKSVELPSDLQGLGSIAITKDLSQTKTKLQKELEAAGVISGTKH